MQDKTILYITANHEPEGMLAYTQDIARKTGLPIISISHNPIDLGINICVGDVGRSGINVHRQMAIGCERATTKYVVWCECDTLYPPEHFKFTPTNDQKIYINKNMWRFLMRDKRYIQKRRPSVCTIISNRLHLLRVLNDMLKDVEQWVDCIEHKSIPESKHNKFKRLSDYDIEYFYTKVSVVSIFHKSGMHQKLSQTRGEKTKVIPYWPKANKLIKELNNGNNMDTNSDNCGF